MAFYTSRLIIREIKYDDARDYYEYASDEDVAKMAGFKPVKDYDLACRLVVGMTYAGDTYAIVLKSNNKFIGTCNIYKKSIRRLKNVYTLGISLAKEYWGYGLGSEAIKALLKICFKSKKAELVEMTSLVNNLRSRNMITNLGFNLDGIIKKYDKNYEDIIYDIALYSLDKEKYKEME